MWDGTPCMCVHDELLHLFPWAWARCRRLRWPSRSSCRRGSSWRCSAATATGQPEAAEADAEPEEEAAVVAADDAEVVAAAEAAAWGYSMKNAFSNDTSKKHGTSHEMCP